MTTSNNIEHLVLKIQDSKSSLSFYEDFFELLGYTQNYDTSNYLNYTNGVIDIGLYYTEEFHQSDEIKAGLGHIAWKTNDKTLFKKLNDLISNYKLEYETLGEYRSHHNQDFYTISFYCPSGNRLELIEV